MVINEKIKKFTEPKNLVISSFTQKNSVRPLTEKQNSVLFKIAKGAYLSLAGSSQHSP